jgi:hypothetical protein
VRGLRPTGGWLPLHVQPPSPCSALVAAHPPWRAWRRSPGHSTGCSGAPTLREIYATHTDDDESCFTLVRYSMMHRSNSYPCLRCGHPPPERDGCEAVSAKGADCLVPQPALQIRERLSVDCLFDCCCGARMTITHLRRSYDTPSRRWIELKCNNSMRMGRVRISSSARPATDWRLAPPPRAAPLLRSAENKPRTPWLVAAWCRHRARLLSTSDQGDGSRNDGKRTQHSDTTDYSMIDAITRTDGREPPPSLY